MNESTNTKKNIITKLVIFFILLFIYILSMGNTNFYKQPEFIEKY
jgi:hypothetical protein